MFDKFSISLFVFIIIASFSMTIKADRHLSQVDNKDKTLTVSGVIYDEKKEPLVGASIYVKGSNKGVISDINGKYTIQVAPNSILTYSFVGMHTQNIPVNNKSVINIIFSPNAIAMQDVEIIGAYGKMQKRSDLVGSAYQVGEKELKNRPQVRVDKMLDGLIPGLQVIPNSTSPDSPRQRYNIRVRGDASLSASSEPLWVVDGLPIYTGERTNQVSGMSYTVSPLSFLNPDDIETITVLKDAASTTIYGANGSNGVILITTKKGNIGKTDITLTARYGITTVNESSRYKVLNGEQYMTLAQESLNNYNAKNGANLVFPFVDNSLNQYSTTNTDWSKVYFDTGNAINANLSIRGGTPAVRYNISTNFNQDKQPAVGNVQQRFVLRARNDISLHKKLSLMIDMSMSYNYNDINSIGRNYYNELPIYSPYYANGSYRLYNRRLKSINDKGEQEWSDSKYYNLIAEEDLGEYYQKNLNTTGKIGITYDIIKGLKYNGSFLTEFLNNYDYQYNSKKTHSGIENGVPTGKSVRGHSNLFTWATIHNISANYTINKKHHLGGTAGFEALSKDTKLLSALGYYFANDNIREVTYSGQRSGSSSASIDRQMSFFGNVNYNFARRYYIDVSVRNDGTSQFGKDVKWKPFAAAGASWNVHNEAFFNSSIINILKLKGSFGSAGNSRLGSDEALGLYSYGASDKYAKVPGASMSGIPNPGLSWEMTYKTNIGARIKLFERLDIDAEYYNNITKDLILNLDVSRTTGGTKSVRNAGKMKNEGFEVSINTVNFDGIFSWTSELNISHNKNTILELYEGVSRSTGDGIWIPGQPKNCYYLVRWAGVDPRSGAPMWYDKNGNITFSYNIENRIPNYTSDPAIYGGFGNTLNYKNFTLTLFLNYTFGGHSLSNLDSTTNGDGYNIESTNVSVNQMDRWQNPGDLTINPKPLWGESTGSSRVSTRYLYKKTNIRLQNLYFAYQIPKNILKYIRAKECSIAFIGTDLCMWTPDAKKGKNSYKTLTSGYPMYSTYEFALNVKF